MGYDLERFVGPVNPGLLCSICRGVLSDPSQAPCEHAYCGGCIRGWLVTEVTCPDDRQPLTVQQLRPIGRYMRNDLNGLQIRCHNVDAGCSHISRLETIQLHEESCKYKLITCPNPGCDVTTLGVEQDRHLAECQHDTKRNHQNVEDMQSAMDQMRTDLLHKIQEQHTLAELRLDAQRRYMVQKTAALEDQVEHLKLHMSRYERDLQELRDTESSRDTELDRATLEKQQLLQIIKNLQRELQMSREETKIRERVDCQQCVKGEGTSSV